MNITATDFKSNLGKYLLLVSTEDIFISGTENLLKNYTILIKIE